MRYTITVLVLILFLTGCSEGYPELGSGYKIAGEGGYTTSVVDSSFLGCDLDLDLVCTETLIILDLGFL